MTVTVRSYPAGTHAVVLRDGTDTICLATRTAVQAQDLAVRIAVAVAELSTEDVTLLRNTNAEE
jgi:hypothetical protein